MSLLTTLFLILFVACLLMIGMVVIVFVGAGAWKLWQRKQALGINTADGIDSTEEALIRKLLMQAKANASSAEEKARLKALLSRMLEALND